MNKELAIQVASLSKVYKLYDNPVDRLKESVHPFRKKYHRDFYALKDVSFEVKKGETLGIIGKNGSGKSTLLKIIAGVLTPAGGSVQINGRISSLLELGAGFNPELTGIENVYFNGTLHGYTKQKMDAKLDSILSFADIGGFVHQPIRTYSSGMMVRLAFAVAMNIDPDILIIDEALAVGDIRFQRKCFANFEEFRNSGRTILFVSHGLDTVNFLCDRAILIDDGAIIREGIPKEVTNLYRRIMLGEHASDDKITRIVGKELQCHPNENGGLSRPTGTPEGNRNEALVAEEKQRIKLLAAEKLKASHGTRKAEIIDYAILDRSGKRVAILESGQQYKLLSRVLVYQDLSEIHLGYPIKDTKGVFLFGTNSYSQRLKTQPQKRGTILEGIVEITMWLAPGDYFLSFRAGNKGEDYHLLADVLHFVVAGDCSQVRGSVVNLAPRMEVREIT